MSSSSCAWIKLSGLPQLLAANHRNGAAAWLVLLEIIDLDCAANSTPGAVEVSIYTLSERTGLDGKAIRKAIQTLWREKLLTRFLPDNDEEPALFKIAVPLPVPTMPPAGEPHRYLDTPDAAPAESPLAILQEVTDLYFNAIGLEHNQFYADKLKKIADTYDIRDIRRAFKRALINEIRSLSFVTRELARLSKQPSDRRSTIEPGVSFS
jgi:hypothetical protein